MPKYLPPPRNILIKYSTYTGTVGFRDLAMH